MRGSGGSRAASGTSLALPRMPGDPPEGMGEFLGPPTTSGNPPEGMGESLGSPPTPRTPWVVQGMHLSRHVPPWSIEMPFGPRIAFTSR